MNASWFELDDLTRDLRNDEALSSWDRLAEAGPDDEYSPEPYEEEEE